MKDYAKEIQNHMEELNWCHKLITGETYTEFVKRKLIEAQKRKMQRV